MNNNEDFYGICKLCGHRQFETKRYPSKNNIEELPIDSYECDICNYVKSRNPEIYEWIMGILEKKGIITYE